MPYDHSTALRPEPAQGRNAMVLAFVPLLLLAALLVFSATGRHLVPSAAAVSDTQAADIDVEVGKVVSLDTSGCAGGDLVIPPIAPGTDAMLSSPSDCTLTFASNNSALGAELTVSEDPGAGGAGLDAMRCVVASCAGDTLDDYTNAGPAGVGVSSFGVRLESASAGASAIWAANPAVNAATDAPNVACDTASTADGTCAFRFMGGADPATDAPGTYQAQVLFAAQAK